LRAARVPGQPGQRVGGAGEQVDGQGRGSAGGSRDRGDVAPDPVGEPVTGALDRRAAQYPHAARVPLTGRQAVDRDVIRVAEIVPAVLLDLPPAEQLVALLP